VLPISTPPTSTDVAVSGWAGITIRVAWELLAHGAKVRPSVLRDARDHVLFHLSPTLSVPQAEDRAATLTREFVARARNLPLTGNWHQDGAMPLSERWRAALESSLNDLSAALVRYHYADGHSLEALEKMMGIDLVSLEASRGGLREVIRRAACDDGLPMESWAPERVDALLARLAAFSLGPCPPLHEILDGLHATHIRRCVRCDRANRLLSNGVLTTEDLRPPKLGARPVQKVDVIAVHFHPDAREHRRALLAEASMPVFPVDDDLLLLDAQREEDVYALLILAAEVAAPVRDGLRAARIEGPGRWSQHGVIGPTVQQARDVIRSRAWGSVEGLGELPSALPQPPDATHVWLGAWVAAAAASLLVLSWVQPGPGTSHSEVSFTPARGGVWATFDVAEEDRLLVLREDPEGLAVLHVSATAADKAAWATGDGSYRLHTTGTGLLLAATPRVWPSLDPLLAEARNSSDPLGTVARRLAVDMNAEVHTWRR
jgi:hypothetical protein